MVTIHMPTTGAKGATGAVGTSSSSTAAERCCTVLYCPVLCFDVLYVLNEHFNMKYSTDCKKVQCNTVGCFALHPFCWVTEGDVEFSLLSFLWPLSGFLYIVCCINADYVLCHGRPARERG